MNPKIIATNLAALKAKYGAAGVTKIKAAITSLIAADKARGLQTRLIALDSSAAMKAVKGKKVTKATEPRQNKAAIDAIYTALLPDYIVLLGAIDVIPHQDLRNPVYGADDTDEFAPGDVPYACEAPYSQEAKDFIGPTRVVGRLPDLTGGSDPAYLVGLLATAAGWTSRPPSAYGTCLAISAEVWKGSTALSLRKLFGTSAGLQLSPTKGPKWTAAQLGRRLHFINCHGAENDPTFYGQRKSNYPVSHLAEHLDGKITEGTIASVECCYGAQLYDAAGGHAGIGNTYLAGKAYGYFGSSTIAYGPADSNGSADLLCQYFLRRVKAGASLGRAVLEARLEFTGGVAELDPVDLKTIAQFNLLGDPSIHPVEVPAPHTAVSTSKGLLSAAKGMRFAAADMATARLDRRRQLLSRGLRIGASQAVAARIAQPKLSGSLLAALKKMASRSDISSPTILSFNIEAPIANASSMAKTMGAVAMTKMAAPSAFHVVTGTARTGETPASQIVALVAKEVGGQIVSYREMHSR